MTMEKTTKSGKNQKFSGEVQEENIGAIKTIRFFLENFICDPLKKFSKSMGLE